MVNVPWCHEHNQPDLMCKGCAADDARLLVQQLESGVVKLVQEDKPMPKQPVNHSKASWKERPLCGTPNWKRASFVDDVTCKRCLAIEDAMDTRSDAEDAA